MTDGLQLRDIGAQLEGLIAEGGAATLRAVIVELQGNEAPEAAEAGRLWGAAMGAVLSMHAADAEPDVVAQRMQQAMELFIAGLDAWLAHVGDAAVAAAAEHVGNRAPLWSDVFREVGEVCAAGRRGLEGDPGARRIMDRHVAAARRAVRALRTAEVG